MATYDKLFETLGLEEYCKASVEEGPMTMAQLLAQANSDEATETSWWEFPFPSLDVLHESCNAIPRTRDMTTGMANAFLDVKDNLKIFLDPLTEPLSWALDSALFISRGIPWWIMSIIFLVLVFQSTRSKSMVVFVSVILGILLFIDHYTYAIETMAIIFVCTIISILVGVPIGIGMSKSNRFQKWAIPVLDMLQTLPTFVYLIPLIFLFSVTESKLYGIAIILYAIVPVIRLTNLGIRLVSKDVIEASEAYGMSPRQRLFGVEIPLALPNIMAGVNQTIMMALAMVVIASLVSAPGLGVLVLRGIANLELGVGLVSGVCIVLLAVLLDRTSKHTLARIDASSKHHK